MISPVAYLNQIILAQRPYRRKWSLVSTRHSGARFIRLNGYWWPDITDLQLLLDTLAGSIELVSLAPKAQ